MCERERERERENATSAICGTIVLTSVWLFHALSTRKFDVHTHTQVPQHITKQTTCESQWVSESGMMVHGCGQSGQFALRKRE